MKIMGGKDRGQKTEQSSSSSSAQAAADKTTPPSLKLNTGTSTASNNSKTTPNSSKPSASSSTSSKSNLDSTTSTETNLTSCATPVSPEMQSLAKTIGSLRQVIEAMKGTCEFLEKSTDYVAKAGPAIKDTEELERVREVLRSRKDEHQVELAELRAKLLSSFEDEIKKSLRDKAIEEVKKRVRKELSTSVNKELHLQTPIQLLEQTSQHESQMLQVRATIHNSEARARNSAVHAGSDPLYKLWLPSCTAHQLFPATVRDLADLSSRDVETLLGAYGVILPHSKTDTQAGDVKQGKASQGKASSLTANINCFMTFIGVPLRAVPAPSSASSSKEGKKLTSTLLISSSF